MLRLWREDGGYLHEQLYGTEPSATEPSAALATLTALASTLPTKCGP